MCGHSIVGDTYNQHIFLGGQIRSLNLHFDWLKNSEWPFTLNALCSLALIDHISINTNDNKLLKAQGESGEALLDDDAFLL
uniref:AlNc14C190G8424 protein n=1 Tax=Albugo laibachii Nc14 TaxID=890382 RepID=F0WPT2_9STRA|nr:AlNc14C190G8424 [Albugo laibachii Nc14]|eukprot:CCA23333.1 AlNc14C190G8424 [Albugo laibachii Nc14]